MKIELKGFTIGTSEIIDTDIVIRDSCGRFVPIYIDHIDDVIHALTAIQYFMRSEIKEGNVYPGQIDVEEKVDYSTPDEFIGGATSEETTEDFPGDSDDFSSNVDPDWEDSNCGYDYEELWESSNCEWENS